VKPVEETDAIEVEMSDRSKRLAKMEEKAAMATLENTGHSCPFCGCEWNESNGGGE
jgi:uncharacterized protein (UPF0212 family)